MVHLAKLVGVRVSRHAIVAVAVLGARRQLREHQSANDCVAPAVAVDAKAALHCTGKGRGGGRQCDKVRHAHDLEIVIEADNAQLAL
eukprot:scaffold6341_cov76-Phaeocystis_antarctica.AAC.9